MHEESYVIYPNCKPLGSCTNSEPKYSVNGEGCRHNSNKPNTHISNDPTIVRNVRPILSMERTRFLQIPLTIELGCKRPMHKPSLHMMLRPSSIVATLDGVRI